MDIDPSKVSIERKADSLYIYITRSDGIKQELGSIYKLNWNNPESVKKRFIDFMIRLKNGRGFFRG
jgi:hypothetical protein